MKKEGMVISLSCGFCSRTYEETIPIPEGWDSRYRAVSEENAFCPDHKPIAAFAESQCPGCVEVWGECALFRAFAYRTLELSPADFSTMEQGICPKRTNGTLLFDGRKIESIDLRESPASEAGTALVKAIGEYTAKYHKPEAK